MIEPRNNFTEAQFNKVLVAALPDLERTVRRLTKGSQDTGDLINDTIVLALRSRHSFEEGTNMGGWLTVIARNALYSQSRKKQAYQLSYDGQDEHMPIAATQFTRVHTAQVIAAVERLKPEMRDAIYIVGFDEATYEEAAVLASVPVGTIKSRVSRGRKYLNEILDK